MSMTFVVQVLEKWTSKSADDYGSLKYIVDRNSHRSWILRVILFLRAKSGGEYNDNFAWFYLEHPDFTEGLRVSLSSTWNGIAFATVRIQFIILKKTAEIKK